MKTELNDFEKGLLDRIIPTQTFSDTKGVQIALRNFIGDDKEKIMAEQGHDERAFRALQSQSVKNILQYLIDYEFVGVREGGVNFLTEKGKNLRRQGSLQKYADWQLETRAKNKVIIHTIETRGYLDQDEIVRNRRALMFKRIRKFVVYPVLLLILLFFLIVGAHRYKLDNNVPFIKNLFKEETQKDEVTKGKKKNKKSPHKNQREE